MAHERVIEAGELPRTEVTCDDEDALPFCLGAEVVLKAFSAHPVAGVFRRVTRHAAELDQLPAEVKIDAAKNLLPGIHGELGESHLEVAHADTTQTAKEPIDHEGEAPRPETGQAARHASQHARYGHYEPIFQSFLHD